MAKPRRGDVLDLTIDDLAFGGEGLGRVQRYVLFVRGAVPGDRLRARVVEARARFGRAAIESLQTPSPDRVEAPCAYFGRCGGCRLQHLSYAAQLRFKEKQVRDCLERIGGLGEFELPPIRTGTATIWSSRRWRVLTGRRSGCIRPTATTWSWTSSAVICSRRR